MTIVLFAGFLERAFSIRDILVDKSAKSRMPGLITSQQHLTMRQVF